MRTFYRLRQTFSQVYCRKLAQCVGLEPTRRTNARPDSNRLQYRYGNTAKLTRCTRSKATKRIWIFSSCPVWTSFVVLPTRSLFVVRFFYNHSHTPVKEYARPIVGIAGIEPCQPKPCQPLSNLQFLITEGFSVTNDTATIHKSLLPELLQ